MSDTTDTTDIITPSDQGTPQAIAVYQTHDTKHDLMMATLSEAQVDFLMQRTPKKEIKFRQGRGGMQYSYVEHGYVTERLNLVFGWNWDFLIVDKQILDDEVMVEASLTVRTSAGHTIIKTQFGGADIKRHASGAKSGKPLSIADDYKAAASDALKKCASLLGIGLDLYGRDYTDAPDQPSDEAPTRAAAHNRQAKQSASVSAPSQPAKPAPIPIDGQAKELCTKAQVTQIRDLAGQLNMPLMDLCRDLNVERLEGLTSARAARVINRLTELANAPASSDTQENTEPTEDDEERGNLLVSLFEHGRAIELSRKETNALVRAVAMGKTVEQLNTVALKATVGQVRKINNRERGLQIIEDSEWDDLQSPRGPKASVQQVKAIFAIGKNERKLTDEQIHDKVVEMFGCGVSELTKEEASQFITTLSGAVSA